MTTKQPTKWYESVAAGSVAGMSSVVVCHPLDTIRTRLQSSPNRFPGGFFQCLRVTLRQEALAGLYKGFLPPFFSQAVYKGVIFTVSKGVSASLPESMGSRQVSAVSGGVAGGVNAFLVTPVELIRNRLQVQYRDVGGAASMEKSMMNKSFNVRHLQQKQIPKALNTLSTTTYSGTMDCLSKVVRYEGLSVLWRGISTTIARDSLGVACYFVGYEYAKDKLIGDGANKGANNATVLAAGAFGGVCFWTVGLPFDTVKTLLQVDQAFTYRGFWHCADVIVQQGGFRQLFRGWQAAFSRGIPGAAITFWSYDKAMGYFRE